MLTISEGTVFSRLVANAHVRLGIHFFQKVFYRLGNSQHYLDLFLLFGGWDLSTLGEQRDAGSRNVANPGRWAPTEEYCDGGRACQGRREQWLCYAGEDVFVERLVCCWITKRGNIVSLVYFIGVSKLVFKQGGAHEKGAHE